MTRIIAPGILLAGAAVAAAAPGAAGHVPVAHAAATKKVVVADDYYGPTKLTIRRGTTVKWVWSFDNGNSHDVKTARRPKGAKFFHSQPAASSFSFSRRLTVPGTYAIVCTLHRTMKMTIVVRR